VISHDLAKSALEEASVENSLRKIGGATTSRPFLAAVDLSPCSEDVLVWAARTARSFDARLVVLHVSHNESEVETAPQALSDLLDRIDGAHCGLDVQSESRFMSGQPAKKILEVAGEIEAQMIVVGRHGRGRVDTLLHGSTAKSVARLSQIPVTVVPPRAHSEDGS
jgi:nucleotide-binding universal stress UspA family protein